MFSLFRAVVHEVCHQQLPYSSSAGDREEGVVLAPIASLTALLDTSHSFLSAPPLELLADGGAASRTNARNSASDMELDDD